MTIRYKQVGEAPQYRELLIADTEAELQATTPATEIAEGHALDTGAVWNWTKVRGSWGAGPFSFDGVSLRTASPIVAPNSISSFLPGQTEGVPDTASLTVVAGVGTNRVALPTGTVFRLDWKGFGPFAFRFGSVSAVAVDTDFPGTVGLPQYFEKPSGATHIAVYGIGGGTLVVSGGSQP